MALSDIQLWCRKHLESLKPNVESGKVVFGGASLDEPLKEGEGMKTNGSVMIVQCDTQEEAMKVVESDIYYKSNVWDASKVRTDLFVRKKACIIIAVMATCYQPNGSDSGLVRHGHYYSFMRHDAIPQLLMLYLPQHLYTPKEWLTWVQIQIFPFKSAIRTAL